MKLEILILTRAGEIINLNQKSEAIKKRYNRIAPIYDWMEAPMEKSASRWWADIAAEVIGKTLEVGVGTRKNIPYYSDDVEIVAIDFSEEMRIAQMYLKEPLQNRPLAANSGFMIVFGITVLGILLLGIFPEPFFQIARHLTEWFR